MSAYDQRLANEAAAAEQCMKLGGVLLRPGTTRPTGFSPSPPAPPGSPMPGDPDQGF